MTECCDFEEECGEQFCRWAERFEIASDVVVVRGNGVDSGRALLEAALGSAEAVDIALGHVPADANIGVGSPDEREPLDETTYVMRSPRNARRLLQAIARLNDVDDSSYDLAE